MGELASAETTGPVDAVALHARTGGNPLFVLELVRSPDGRGVIGEVLQRSLDRFDDASRTALACATTVGSGTPLALLAAACSCSMEEVAERLEPAVRAGVLDDVAPGGVRFHHALVAEAAGRLGDQREVRELLAAAWDAVGGSTVTAVLDALDVEGPYVLASHSFAGNIARVFAAEHAAQMTPKEWRTWVGANNRTPAQIADYPDIEQDDFNASRDEVEAADPLGPMPVVVLTDS